jgi:toxin ParE1/3/4
MVEARRPVVFSPEAEADLFDIWDFLARAASDAVADRQLQAIDRVCDLLVGSPLAGRARDEFRAGIRSFVAPPFVVFYRVTDSTIEIVRVLHGKRDTGAAFSDPL